LRLELADNGFWLVVALIKIILLIVRTRWCDNMDVRSEYRILLMRDKQTLETKVYKLKSNDSS
jgi:hypothetical protein